MGIKPQPVMIQQNQKSAAYIVSSLLMFVGYCLFVIGIVSPSWRLEIGYTYGLWIRCDDGVCKYVFIGFNNFLAVVQSGIILSLLLLTISMICLFIEGFMKTTHTSLKNAIRTGKVVTVAAAVGEIVAAFSLGLYGGKTVMARDRLPVLTTGFAVTGLGVILSLMGNIIRAMGPPATWGQGMCCLAPKHRYRENLPVILYGVMESDTPSAETFHSPVGSKGKIQSRDKDYEKVKLLSCFHKSQKSYLYSSVPSTVCSSLERGYRHYEEISFEDMPPPPLELLNYLPPVNPSPSFKQESTPTYLPHEHSCHITIPTLDQNQSKASSSRQCFQPTSQPQQYTAHHQSLSFPHTEVYRKQFGMTPQPPPRQTKQQRSIIKSAQRHFSLTTHEISKASTQSKTALRPIPRAPDMAPVSRYQTLHVDTSRELGNKSGNT